MGTLIGFVLGMLTMWLILRWAIACKLQSMGVLGGLKTLNAVGDGYQALDQVTRAHFVERFGQLIAEVCNEISRQCPEFTAKVDRALRAGTDRHPCPFCAELILPTARVCPHCRSQLPSYDESVYPEEYKGVRYRCERDGSVVMATPNGPLRFSKWQEFWNAIY